MSSSFIPAMPTRILPTGPVFGRQMALPMLVTHTVTTIMEVTVRTFTTATWFGPFAILGGKITLTDAKITISKQITYDCWNGELPISAVEQSGVSYFTTPDAERYVIMTRQTVQFVS